MSSSKISPPKVTTSVVSAGDSIAQSVDAIKAKPVKFGGVNGFFVSPARLLELEKKIDHLMISGETTKTPSDLIAMHEQITMLQNSQMELQQRLESEKMVVAKANNDIEQMKKSLSAKENLLSAKELKYLADVKSINFQLATKAKENSELQRDFLKAKKGFDPELVLKLKEEKEAAGQEVNRLTNAISQLKSELHAEKKEVTKAKAAIEAAENGMMMKRHANLLASSALKGRDEIFGETKTTYSLSPTLQAIIGGKRVKHIIAAAEARQDQVKDRLYESLQAVRGSKDKKILGIIDVLQMALDWVKAQSFKARLILQGWVDTIVKDIATMSLKSVQEYRDELKLLIEKQKVRKGKLPSKSGVAHPSGHTDPELTYLEEGIVWLKVLSGRVKRVLFGTPPTSVSPRRGVLNGAWHWLTSFFTSNTEVKPDEVIFDVNSVGENGEKPPLTEVEPKPVE